MFYKVKMHETCALRVRTVNLLSFHCYCYCCCYYCYCCCCCLFVFHKRAFCILCSVCSARCRLPHSTKVFAKMFSLQFPPQSRSRTRLRLRLRLCLRVSFAAACAIAARTGATTANGDTFQAFATLFASHNCLPSGSSNNGSSIRQLHQQSHPLRCAAAALLLMLLLLLPLLVPHKLKSCCLVLKSGS